MASNLTKNNLVVGITAGIVASIIGPILIPAIKRSARPVAKTLVRGGMTLYQKGREAAANAGEMMEDVMAEIHAEEAEKYKAAFGGTDVEAKQQTQGGNGSRDFSETKNGAASQRTYTQSGASS